MNNLESKIIEHITRCPFEALELFIKESKLGIPTAVGYDETLGYYVIQSSGQGPYIIWKQK